jgi:hypothetical protein
MVSVQTHMGMQERQGRRSGFLISFGENLPSLTESLMLTSWFRPPNDLYHCCGSVPPSSDLYFHCFTSPPASLAGSIYKTLLPLSHTRSRWTWTLAWRKQPLWLLSSNPFFMVSICIVLTLCIVENFLSTRNLHVFVWNHTVVPDISAQVRRGCSSDVSRCLHAIPPEYPGAFTVSPMTL